MTSHLAVAEHIEETLNQSGRIVISAVGYSMLPLIPPNSVIEIVKCPEAELKIGDILLVKRNASFILHRLCEIRCKNGFFFITKGDNVNRRDAPVEGRMILGKVIAVGSSKSKKLFWYFANTAMIFFTLKTHPLHKRLTQKKWYKALSKIRALFIKRRSLVAPIVKKMDILPQRIARSLQWAHASWRSTRLLTILPKMRVSEFLPNDSAEALSRLWERTFPDLAFKSSAELKHSLFSHFLADRPFVFTATIGQRCCGLLFALESYPDSRGQKSCSLETVAVDPDFRHKGLGSALIDKLRERCRNQNVSLITVCRNKIFFPGLHPENHEKAIDFLVRRGFESPVFSEEMFLTPSLRKKPDFLKPSEKRCFDDRITFQVLTPIQKADFLEFLKKEDSGMFNRYSNNGWGLCFDNLQNQGLVCAALRGKIIGCCRYDTISNRLGQAALYRESKLKEFRPIASSDAFIVSGVRIEGNLQGRGIGTGLVNHCFDFIFNGRGKIIFWESNIPQFFTRFGARKLNVYLKLYASTTNS